MMLLPADIIYSVIASFSWDPALNEALWPGRFNSHDLHNTCCAMCGFILRVLDGLPYIVDASGTATYVFCCSDCQWQFDYESDPVSDVRRIFA